MHISQVHGVPLTINGTDTHLQKATRFHRLKDILRTQEYFFFPMTSPTQGIFFFFSVTTDARTFLWGAKEGVRFPFVTPGLWMNLFCHWGKGSALPS